jgi:hypothetical protein
MVPSVSLDPFVKSQTKSVQLALKAVVGAVFVLLSPPPAPVLIPGADSVVFETSSSGSGMPSPESSVQS